MRRSSSLMAHSLVSRFRGQVDVMKLVNIRSEKLQDYQHVVFYPQSYFRSSWKLALNVNQTLHSSTSLYTVLGLGCNSQKIFVGIPGNAQRGEYLR